MAFLLDTNICVYALKGNELVLGRLVSRTPQDLSVSVVTEAELRTGAAKSTAPVRALRRVESFLAPLRILPFTSEDARAYARVRARLEKAGRPIGPLDTLIGSHAVSRELTLVTNNEREFSRIPGLALENWAS